MTCLPLFAVYDLKRLLLLFFSCGEIRMRLVFRYGCSHFLLQVSFLLMTLDFGHGLEKRTEEVFVSRE